MTETALALVADYGDHPVLRHIPKLLGPSRAVVDLDAGLGQFRGHGRSGHRACRCHGFRRCGVGRQHRLCPCTAVGRPPAVLAVRRPQTCRFAQHGPPIPDHMGPLITFLFRTAVRAALPLSLSLLHL